MGACGLLKENDFQLFWCGESNYQVIYAVGWLEDFQTINDKCLSYLNHDFATDIKLLSFLFLICVSMWITEREWFQTVLISWIQLSNHFCFGWVQDLQTITSKCFSYLNQNVVTTVKLLTFWCVEAYDYWKRVVSNCFDMVNPIIRSFLLLVDWNIFKQ